MDEPSCLLGRRSLPGRRHGTWQDASGHHIDAVAGIAGATACRRAYISAPELEVGTAALRSCLDTKDTEPGRNRPQPDRRDRRGRRHCHRHLRPAGNRGRTAGTADMDHHCPRRGPLNQEPRHADIQVGYDAQGRLPPHAHRHAAPEPPQRDLEPLPVRQPRPAGQLQPVHRTVHHSHRTRPRPRTAAAAAPSPVALPVAPHQGRCPQRAAREDRDNPASGTITRRAGSLRQPTPASHPQPGG